MVSLSDCSFIARIVFAVAGVVIGAGVGITFGFEYHNINASVWGFVSGVAAAYLLYIHVTFMQEKYREDPQLLRCSMYCGCLFQTAGLCGFVVYVVLAVHDDQGLLIYGPGYYVASVWSLMTLKWGFVLFYFSRSYWRCIMARLQLLPLPEKTGFA